MQARYPDDIFEAVIRKNATSGVYEFRIKCTDCPGKVRGHIIDVAQRTPVHAAPCLQHYTPGPGESLQNFEVHLKNRQHRQKVNARLNPPAES